jgi:hypothetical protein
MVRRYGAWMIAGALLLALGWGLGCKSRGPEKKAEPGAPQVGSLKLAPAEARPGDKLTANAETKNATGGGTRVEYEWYVNDKKVEATDREFDTKGMKVGDRVSFKARAVDAASGKAGDWKTSNTVALGAVYGPPLKGVKIQPSPLYAKETASAVIDYGETDPDSVSNISYRWSVNGTLLQVDDMEEVTGLELDPKYYAGGDKVGVEVCTDGQFQAPNVWSALLQVVDAPPVFKSEPFLEAQGKFGLLHLDVTDADGDQLSVKVTQSPPGAEVDLTEWGLVRVDCTNVAPGRYPLAVKISDGHGGDLNYSTNMTVPGNERNPPPPPPPPEENP